MKQRFEINNNLRFYLGAAFILTSMLLTSCYKDISGCDDPLAANYSIDYDIPCKDGCCEYPTAIINWKHTYDQDNYRLNNTYVNSFSDGFSVLDQKIYFGDVAFGGFDGPISFLEKNTYTTFSGESVEILTDFFLLKKTLTTSKFSMLRYAGQISSIAFNMQLGDDINEINANSLTSASPLSNNERMRNVDDDFYSAYFKIAHGNNLSDTVDYYLTVNNPINISFAYGDTIVQGQNITSGVQINYDLLFDDVDFNQWTKDQVIAKLEESLPTIFSELQ